MFTAELAIVYVRSRRGLLKIHLQRYNLHYSINAHSTHRFVCQSGHSVLAADYTVPLRDVLEVNLSTKDTILYKEYDSTPINSTHLIQLYNRVNRSADIGFQS